MSGRRRNSARSYVKLKVTEPRKEIFDAELLRHIAVGRSDETVKRIIAHGKLAKASDDFGTLLHRAATHRNHELARYLLKKGSKVNAIGKDGRTALMIAVQQNDVGTVKVLVNGRAIVDIVGGDGKTALQMAITPRNVNFEILYLLLDRMRATTSTDEELFNKMVSAGCTLHQAVSSGHIEVVKSLLRRTDTNANSKDSKGSTPLHLAAKNGNAAIVRLLLERGADPNDVNVARATPLSLLLNNANINDKNQVHECAELLLIHGARPVMSKLEFFFYLHYAKLFKYYVLADTLIAHLVILEERESTSNSMDGAGYMNRRDLLYVKCLKYYESCQQKLQMSISGELTLLDLLAASEWKMRLLVRNEKIVCAVKDVCSKCHLKEVLPYYYNALTARTSNAINIVKLEEKAIRVICKIFRCNYNQCYFAARGIFEYLDKWDLEQLCKV